MTCLFCGATPATILPCPHGWCTIAACANCKPRHRAMNHKKCKVYADQRSAENARRIDAELKRKDK